MLARWGDQTPVYADAGPSVVKYSGAPTLSTHWSCITAGCWEAASRDTTNVSACRLAVAYEHPDRNQSDQISDPGPGSSFLVLPACGRCAVDGWTVADWCQTVPMVGVGVNGLPDGSVVDGVWCVCDSVKCVCVCNNVCDK